jgi:hypothetical protein
MTGGGGAPARAACGSSSSFAQHSLPHRIPRDPWRWAPRWSSVAADSLPIFLPCFRLRARIACPGRQVGSARRLAHAGTALYLGYPGAARDAQYALPSPVREEKR